MLLQAIFLATILSSTYAVSSTNGEKLLQSIVVNRHGVRASSNRIPLKDCTYFQGQFGQVTRMGEEENFKVGVHLASHYSALFTGGYKVKKHHFYSSGEVKCLSSAQNTFHGIFKDSLTSVDPIPSAPVRTWTTATDHIMMFTSTCSNVISEMGKKGTTTNEFKTKAAANKDIIARIQEASGLNVSLSLGNVPLAAEQIILATHHLDYVNDPSELADCLYDDQDLNDAAIELATFRVQMFNRKEDRELAKMQASPFVNYVLKLMKSRINQTDDPDFVFFSGSNPNVLAPLQLFNQDCPGRVPFGSYFYFDLYILDGVTKLVPPYNEDEVGIKVGYRVYNTTTDTFSDKNNDITTANCGGKEYCTMEEIRQMIYTDEEWSNICFPPEEPLTNSPPSDTPSNTWPNASIVVVIVLAVLLLAAIVVAVVFAIFAVYKARLAASFSKSEPIAVEELKITSS